MKRLISLLITFTILSAIVIPVAASTQSLPANPYFNILKVDMDKSVTIQVFNFPSNDAFKVTMGKNGTKGVGGVQIGTTDSGKGGTFEATYSIPSSLSGQDIIAIRLQSPTSGYYAYNWFFNNTATSGTATPVPGYTGFPTFSIESVVADKSVTIKTNNLPQDDTFTVTMGKNGTLGVGGVEVGKTDSGSGGSQTLTYDIPASLAGLSIIAIRI